jgi:hypothetical protein
VRLVELFSFVSQTIDYLKPGCYNASVAGACTQAFDPPEELPAFDAPGWVAESLRT